MLNVYLLRHGQTQWNAEGNRYCGRTDIPLTEKGIRQAQLVREQLGKMSFMAVYASPLERAYRTAVIAAGREDVIRDQRLIEADFGNWEGKTKEVFMEENAALWKNWMNDPATARAGGTGETGMEVVRRVDDFFTEILNRHPSGNILVVGHNGINRLFLAYKLGMPLKHYRRIVQENSSVTLFSLEPDGELMLKLLNSKGLNEDGSL
ncbi:phosphoglycerate mutase family protein [Fulvivirgaceae bacterium PWU4]|uniref:Phosphoglycerate mutase family protein n=1 Tax=Chryseosolibacter histidini TaxID=2782349 RepID=A0AAP2GGZ9_9BACT|nr:histidine phosphatase family protein [Chryseosolibacter histidini]MBT1695499.1 phosphoglycerate mutase family protein [Chryseosolibacter histidini]